MADSTTNLDTLSAAQAQKEVTANAFFDAASPATLYGRRASTTTALTWGYYGGKATLKDGTLATIANGTLALTASNTNYVVAAKSTGAVSVSTATTNWNDTQDYWRLYSIVTGTATVTSYTDYRELAKFTGADGIAALVFNGIYNLGLSASVGSNALTIRLKQADGSTDPADTDAGVVRIAFRSATATTGSVTVRSVTAATSLVISAGSTLGFAASESNRIWVGALDNAGTVELCAWATRSPHTPWPVTDHSIVTTTAEGGAGGADLSNVIYSATARTSVPLRVLGYVDIQTDATPGNWANAPTKVEPALMPPGALVGDPVKRVWGEAVGWTRNSDNSTDTSDVTLASFVIPAGLMAANDTLELITSWSHTASASVKRLRPYFGGTLAGQVLISTATFSSSQVGHVISNRNATNAQIGGNGTFGYGGVGAPFTTMTVDTAGANVTVEIKCSWTANVAGESITLERYNARLLSPTG